MRRIVSIALAGAFALALIGCAGGARQAAKPPPKLPEKEIRATPQSPPPEAPRLIAPPPAYGNKIVMAKGPARTAEY